MGADRREIGRVSALWRYPVKSMGAEALSDVEVSWHGLAGDRRWAFVRDGQVRNGFPWLTIRQRPELVRYQPFFSDPELLDRSPTMVRTPSGQVFDVVDPDLAGELGDGVRVIKLNRGTFDALPLSLVTTQTVATVGAMVAIDLDVLRFRPNLVVDTGDGVPFQEDDHVGAVLCVGGMRMRVDRRDNRCAVVNVDPRTGARDPRILRAIAGERGTCLGVYGSVVQPGPVAVGDRVVVEA